MSVSSLFLDFSPKWLLDLLRLLQADPGLLRASPGVSGAAPEGSEAAPACSGPVRELREGWGGRLREFCHGGAR